MFKIDLQMPPVWSFELNNWLYEKSNKFNTLKRIPNQKPFLLLILNKLNSSSITYLFENIFVVSYQMLLFNNSKYLSFSLTFKNRLWVHTQKITWNRKRWSNQICLLIGSEETIILPPFSKKWLTPIKKN